MIADNCLNYKFETMEMSELKVPQILRLPTFTKRFRGSLRIFDIGATGCTIGVPADLSQQEAGPVQ